MGMLSTIDLFIKLACFVKGKYTSLLKTAGLNYLAQGGQLYCSFPFSKDSLVKGTHILKISDALQSVLFPLSADFRFPYHIKLVRFCEHF